MSSESIIGVAHLNCKLKESLQPKVDIPRTLVV